MLCDDCGKNEAHVHIVQVGPDGRVEKNLCEQCALKHSDSMFSLQRKPPRSARGRFSATAVRVIEFAQQRAKDSGRVHISTGDLLLGLLSEPSGIAAKALNVVGVNSELCEAQMSEEDEELNFRANNPYYTPTARRAMEMTVFEARELGNEYVGTEHILLSIINEVNGQAMRALSALGAEREEIRDIVLQMLAGNKNAAADQKEESSKTPYLDHYGRDLTQLVKTGQVDPTVGREKEIRRLIQILSRRTKNNPVLIGEPGVGKTAIAEGLAGKILDGAAGSTMKKKRLVSLSMANLVAGARYRGEFEERLKGIMDEVIADKDIILFIDELHTLIGAGSAEGSLDAANMMKPALSRGEMQVIGATTLEEYKKYFEKDAALTRRFQTVMVEEATPEEARTILAGLKGRYEEFHGAVIDDSALDAAVKLSHRYIQDRFLPDKAIDVMDEAAARAKVASMEKPATREIAAAEEKISRLSYEKRRAIAAQEYEKAAKLRDEEKQEQKELDALNEEFAKNGGAIHVTADDIADVVSAWTGIPVRDIAAKESERLMNLEKKLKRRVIGQDEAVAALSKAIRRSRAGLKDPKRPIGSFLFLGPTGVGKTELAKTLAATLFGTEDALIRFDMSEYMEKYSVSRMVGAPPGYVGYDEGGQLTDAVRRRPYSIILLDEIEKASSDVFNILLQVLEDGRLTDSKGRKVDFCNTVVIMTSNAGASALKDGDEGVMGFAANSMPEEKRKKIAAKQVMNEVQNIFKPEFLNRIDEQIVFNSLGKTELMKIVDLLIADVKSRLAEKNILLEVSPSAKNLLIEKGTDKKYGARPLRRTVQKMVEDELATLILSRTFKNGDTVSIKKAGEGLAFVKKIPKETTKSTMLTKQIVS